MRRGVALALALLVAACGPGATRGLLSGPRDAVRQAATAARDCGIGKLRIDPPDEASAMLVVDPATPGDRIACIRDWARHRPELQWNGR